MAVASLRGVVMMNRYALRTKETLLYLPLLVPP
jgi:hypothetical protein